MPDATLLAPAFVAPSNASIMMAKISPRGRMLRVLECGSVLWTVLLAGYWGPAAPSQGLSFSSVKERFESEFKAGDVAARQKAIEVLAEHGHPETVRYLLQVVQEREAYLVQSRLSQVGATERRNETRSNLARVESLVKRGKLGEGALEKARAEAKAAEAEVKGLSKGIAEESKLLLVLRRSVGWVVVRCSPSDRTIAARAVISAFRDGRTVEDQADLLRVMAWVDHPEVRAALEAQVTSPEPALRVGALGALEERGGLQALRPALKVIHDPHWQVQAAAVRILRLVGGLEAARALTDVLEKADGRLIGDAVAALRHLTGQDFHDNVHLWREWLGREGANLPVPTESANAAPAPQPQAPGKGEKRQRGTGFYGIETTSKHVVYVIDYSGSMTATLGERSEVGADAGTPKPGGPRKVDGAVTELLKSIEGLSRDCTYNVVLFSTNMAAWRDKMQPATPENKEAVRQWLLGRPPVGSTNLFGGLETAFQFAGRGSFDKHYKVVADTILLLSDGSPTEGRFQAAADILREIRNLNELRRVAIHCVGLGRSINANLLRNLASQNDGTFVHVTR